jgi:hypothetical protein
VIKKSEAIPMKIKAILVTIMLCLGLHAGAEFTTIAEAYEVAVVDLRLPGNSSGTLSLKRCASCDTETIRVTANTRYVVNERDLALAEFTKRIQPIKTSATHIATVVHHLESNVVTAIYIVI